MIAYSIVSVMLIVLLVFNVSIVLANTKPELLTDRPDITESATVVPFRCLQIESGFIYENILRSPTQDLTFITFNTTLFRYGVSKLIELRLGIEYLGNYNNNKVMMSEISEIGTGPLYLGMKIQVTKENGWLPEIAAIPGINLPFTAYRPFSSHNIEPEIVFAFSNTLNDWLSLGYNLGSKYFHDSKSFLYWYSMALGADLSGNFGTYIELNSYFPSISRATHYLNSGFVFLPVHNLQLDCSGGIGLDSFSSDFHWGFGFSWRIPD
ncbi:MAG: transporter [Candidatus Kapabacteria bacterium]|nr:transporter [Candidatus Kapabacteria bacterium]